MKYKQMILLDINIFDFVDYKSYLKQIAGGAGLRRGIKAKFAQALNCQPTYVSQILHRSAHLSLEQADVLGHFLNLNVEEYKYFMLLVQKDRAGSISLEAFFRAQIEEIRKERLVLTKRLQLKSALSLEEQAIYYSSWHYAAVHIAVTVPSLQTAESLANYLGLSRRKVKDVITFLIGAKLLSKQEGRYVVGSSHISLSSDSPLLGRHHANFRQKAIASLDREDASTDLHYSAVISLSRKDFIALKDQILELLKAQRELIKGSKEEELYCYSFDFFGLQS